LKKLFYYNFETLQKKGFIEPVETIHIENRPNKTLYTITDEGRQYLEQEIYNNFKKFSNIEDLYISIYLLKYINPVKAAIYLEDSINEEKNVGMNIRRQKITKN